MLAAEEISSLQTSPPAEGSPQSSAASHSVGGVCVSCSAFRLSGLSDVNLDALRECVQIGAKEQFPYR